MQLPNGGTVTFTCRCQHLDHIDPADVTFDTPDQLNAHAAQCTAHEPSHPHFREVEVRTIKDDFDRDVSRIGYLGR